MRKLSFLLFMALCVPAAKAQRRAQEPYCLVLGKTLKSLRPADIQRELAALGGSGHARSTQLLCANDTTFEVLSFLVSGLVRGAGQGNDFEGPFRVDCPESLMNSGSEQYNLSADILKLLRRIAYTRGTLFLEEIRVRFSGDGSIRRMNDVILNLRDPGSHRRHYMQVEINSVPDRGRAPIATPVQIEERD